MGHYAFDCYAHSESKINPAHEWSISKRSFGSGYSGRTVKFTFRVTVWPDTLSVTLISNR